MVYYRVLDPKAKARSRGAAAALILAALTRPAGAVDLVLSASHAASYYAVLAGLGDRTAVLVNVDRHDDLAALRDTEALRRGWEGAASAEGRAAYLRGLRSRGAVSCWNWIEPLMPRPVERALWIAPPQVALPSIGELEAKLKAGRRRIGEWPIGIADPRELRAAIPKGPWLLSIDLDYFDGSSDPGGELRALFAACRERPPLMATAAVSMPYLSSEEAAGRLARELVDAVAAQTDWGLVIDPAFDGGPIDRGRDASLRTEGRRWREYDPVADGLFGYAREAAGSRARLGSARAVP
jgi:hypothetical protein